MAIVGSNTTPDTYQSASASIQRWDINRHTVAAGDTITKVGYFGDDSSDFNFNVFLVDAVSGDLIYTHNFLTQGGTDYVWFEDVVSVAIPAGYVGKEVFVVLEKNMGASNTRYDSGMSSGDVEFNAASITDPLALGGWNNRTNGPSFYMEVTAGASAPTLSSLTPSGTIGTATTATIGATTDTTSGTFYVVVDSAANIAGITAAQIKLGNNTNDVAAVADNSSTVTTTTPSAGVTELTAATPYSYAVMQSDTADSIAYTGTFTTAAAATLSLDSPDTVTHGTATTATGDLLSTVNVTTGMTLEYGTVAIAQTATFVDPDLNFTPDVGVPTAYGTANAVDSLPLTPDSASTGYTPYQVTLDVTDGVTPVSRNVTNVAAGAVQTFQVMEAGVNKTAGEGLGGSDLVDIEDNHQVTVPSVVDGVTLTIDPDTLDYSVTQAALPAGSSITFDAVYYSPTLEQSSKIAVTITAPNQQPAQFTFTDITGQALSTAFTDDQALTGGTLVDGNTTLTVTNGLTSVTGPSGTFDGTPKTYAAGSSYVRASVTSSGSYSTAVTQTPSVNGISDEFSVTTLAAVAPIMPATAANNVVEPGQTFGFFTTSNTPLPAAVYSLSGTDAAVLSIDSSTALVTANSATDAGVKSTYSYTVTADNTVTASDSTDVTTTIIEVSDGDDKAILSTVVSPIMFTLLN